MENRRCLIDSSWTGGDADRPKVSVSSASANGWPSVDDRCPVTEEGARPIEEDALGSCSLGLLLAKVLL